MLIFEFVYRIWPYKAGFIDELLCYMSGPDGLFGADEVFDPETLRVVRETIERHRHLLGTPEGRRAVLREVVRLGAGRNFLAHFDQRMRIRTSLMAVVGSTRDIRYRGEIAMALERAGDQSRRGIVALIEYIMKSLGLRFRRPEWTVEQLQAAGAAALQGLAMVHDVGQAAQERADAVGAPGGQPVARIIDVPLPGPGLGESDAQWSLAGLTYLGIVDAFLEPDPDFTPEPLA